MLRNSSRYVDVLAAFSGGWRRARWGWAAAALLVLTLAQGAWTAHKATTAVSDQSVSPHATPGRAPATAPTAVPAFRQANNVAVLTVHGVIDSVTQTSLERRIKKAVDDGADAIVLDINTPGGEMFSTLEICNLLKDRTATPPNVVAWVHPSAYSAGTIIALACREIIVSPGATFGDAAPIKIGVFGLHPLPPAERAKMEAPILTELIDSARRSHYDEKLVQSFAKLGSGLWMLENVQSGERVFVDVDEYRAVFGEDPPQAHKTGGMFAPPLHQGVTPLRPFVDQSIPRADSLAGMSADKQALEIEKQQSLPPVRQPLTSADKGKWRLVRQVIDDTTLLTLKADEAVYYGLATAVIVNDAELASYFGTSGANIMRYDQTWSESLVRFLLSWPVRMVLIVIFVVALFIELAAPGFGVFGVTAIVALLILVGAPALAGLAQWWDILLIALGLLLVAVELFILPGFGVTGVLGVVCLLIGIVGTFIAGGIATPEGQTQLWTGLLTTLTAAFLGGVGIWLVSRQIHTLPLLNRLILHTELRAVPEAGSATATGGLLQAMRAAQRALQPGDTGVAETDLRPAGRANINGKLVDVQSVGTYIEKGATVRVVSVGRYVIEVEEIS
jgi:membrane-bound serine protease (ClpP class)